MLSNKTNKKLNTSYNKYKLVNLFYIILTFRSNKCNYNIRNKNYFANDGKKLRIVKLYLLEQHRRFKLFILAPILFN